MIFTICHRASPAKFVLLPIFLVTIFIAVRNQQHQAWSVLMCLLIALVTMSIRERVGRREQDASELGYLQILVAMIFIPRTGLRRVRRSSVSDCSTITPARTNTTSTFTVRD